jgi:hypothetical protein
MISKICAHDTPDFDGIFHSYKKALFYLYISSSKGKQEEAGKEKFFPLPSFRFSSFLFFSSRLSHSPLYRDLISSH